MNEQRPLRANRTRHAMRLALAVIALGAVPFVMLRDPEPAGDLAVPSMAPHDAENARPLAPPFARPPDDARRDSTTERAAAAEASLAGGGADATDAGLLVWVRSARRGALLPNRRVTLRAKGGESAVEGVTTDVGSVHFDGVTEDAGDFEVEHARVVGVAGAGDHQVLVDVVDFLEVAGTVVDARLEPVAGAMVWFRPPSQSALTGLTSGADGTFVIDAARFTPGEIRIGGDHPVHGKSEEIVVHLPVVPDAPPLVLRLGRSDAGVEVRGTLVQPSGAPAAGVALALEGWQATDGAASLRSLSYRATTAADGAFAFQRVERASYKLSAGERCIGGAAKLPVQVAKEMDGSVVQLGTLACFEPPVVVTGVAVAPDGRPAAHATARWGEVLERADAQGRFVLRSCSTKPSAVTVEWEDPAASHAVDDDGAPAAWRSRLSATLKDVAPGAAEVVLHLARPQYSVAVFDAATGNALVRKDVVVEVSGDGAIYTQLLWSGSAALELADFRGRRVRMTTSCPGYTPDERMLDVPAEGELHVRVRLVPSKE